MPLVRSHSWLCLCDITVLLPIDFEVRFKILVTTFKALYSKRLGTCRTALFQEHLPTAHTLTRRKCSRFPLLKFAISCNLEVCVFLIAVPLFWNDLTSPPTPQIYTKHQLYLSLEKLLTLAFWRVDSVKSSPFWLSNYPVCSSFYILDSFFNITWIFKIIFKIIAGRRVRRTESAGHSRRSPILT